VGDLPLLDLLDRPCFMENARPAAKGGGKRTLVSAATQRRAEHLVETGPTRDMQDVGDHALVVDRPEEGERRLQQAVVVATRPDDSRLRLVRVILD
jgi:hypothetical protein